ncbi:iron ABC transporter permease [Paenibacillus sp. SYP-B3998]|uniref:Iron ABC transporter permease n=1 Tax=Paenibacillus sp. SYP-B3998 TaxID=2678564 RepID=A0A6G4A405_9BACL|nr:iron ABC transporter permease [Paenibacillus sp. SYP-B3998]NEW09236.1 iron ABC transporter permease [Paenibacillus sp. SYP-B3998]
MLVMTLLGLLIVAVFMISMNSGYIRLSPIEVFKTLFGGGTPKQSLILFEFRLPRIVISVLVGAGLAVSGCILQGITRNSLADPGILGINAGAGLMVVLFIAFYPNNQAVPVFFLPMLAMLGAGTAAALIFLLSIDKHRGISPKRMILSGIAIAAGISAAMIVLTIRLDPNDYQFVAVWLAGSIWGSNWKFVMALLPWLAVLLPFIFYKARSLNVLTLGDPLAISLGSKVGAERFVLLSCSVALAGACVAIGGGISFVGLVGPHLARQLVGSKHQYLLPASALAGGLLLIIADLLARMILQPSEIPTGIVVAIIGAPYFLYLLAKSKA